MMYKKTKTRLISMKKLLYYCLAIIARPNSDFIYTVNKLGLYGCNKMRAYTDINIYTTFIVTTQRESTIWVNNKFDITSYVLATVCLFLKMMLLLNT